MIDLDFEDLFLKSKCKKTRGNAFKLMIPKSKTKIRHHFFTCSIIKHWNRLKSSDINVRSIRLFKKNIIKYLRRENIWWWFSVERWILISLILSFINFVSLTFHILYNFPSLMSHELWTPAYACTNRMSVVFRPTMGFSIK